MTSRSPRSSDRNGEAEAFDTQSQQGVEDAGLHDVSCPLGLH